MVTCDDPFLFRYMEGNMIHKFGDYFLALLAPQQLIERNLSVREIIDVYRQGVKDPAIMDNQCMLGNKGYLLTYHVRSILNSDSLLLPSTTSTSLVYTDYRGSVIVYWNDKLVYMSRAGEIPAREDTKEFAYYRWVT